MGYDCHITRKARWFDEDGPTISRSEWEAVVAGSTLRPHDDPDVWILPDGARQVLVYGEDDILIQKPETEAAIAALSPLAQALDARIQGDDAAEYDPNRDGVRDAAGHRSWLSRLIGR